MKTQGSMYKERFTPKNSERTFAGPAVRGCNAIVQLWAAKPLVGGLDHRQFHVGQPHMSGLSAGWLTLCQAQLVGQLAGASAYECWLISRLQLVCARKAGHDLKPSMDVQQADNTQKTPATLTLIRNSCPPL
ncbi:unnamed protein product [Clonostachys rosea]|uniref:Uncharacterized protein n=1 Tax=Bionectria ochroleuca TaxID=29856 RepID=A0ABY6UV23_BIOOC|nr:unnamed protein product [Clonostachys rosea]